ncbi:MAG TPA: hypothetical protein VLJ17_19820 [Xanthobacteraceae bacterium]|nr:hypothetical protein [Xanthobacteraceae bacterium]
MFQKAAVLLKATIPTARFHAQRLTRPTISNAGGDRRTVGALVAIRNADFLLAAASHRSSRCDLAVERDKIEQGGCHDQGLTLREHERAKIGAPRVKIHRPATFQPARNTSKTRRRLAFLH